MDLGGGSVQLSWIVSPDGECRTSRDSAQSLPYGAARLTKLLKTCDNDTLRDLWLKVEKDFVSAYKALEVPAEIEATAASNGGINLYLSGGGFRAWGHILMSMHNTNGSDNSPYPIPIINGYHVDSSTFFNTEIVKGEEDYRDVFRISKRRASQIPAVLFLISALRTTLTNVKEVFFCQGKSP